ncbi:MAG: TonB-dependent receptor, partial [Balneolales bacterium]|nr:TonB-dependent receptor [Balneolales bacterium]
FTYNDVEYNNISNDTTLLLDRDDTGLTSALYLQNSWTPGNLMVNYGLRLAHYSNTEQFYPEPRFSATYSFNDQFKVKGAWGLYNQFVTRVVREDVSQGSRDFWLLADNDVNTTSSSTHYILGASYETTGFLFDVEAFYKDLRGLSEYTLRFTTEGTFRDQTTNLDEVFYEGDGYSQGIEFLAQKKFGKYTGWIGYTISEVIHEFEELSEEPFPALHDQTHELKLVNSLRLGRLTLSGTWVYATGKPYTSPTGGYEITYLDGTSVSYIAVGEKNAYRLPDYHRLDLSAVLNIPFDEYTNADVGFSIFNLYNRSNVWYKTFEIIDGDFITTDVNTIGITPNLFFTINF